jgi:AAA family ATP:ADP antiporter
MGGNPFAGFSLFFKSPYLLGIGLFIIIYTFMNTVVYFQLKNMMVEVDPDTRTQIWASIDLAVNFLAAATQLFATSRLATRFGLVTSLAIIPVLMIGGFMVLALVPILSVLIGLQIARRAGNYAITRPCREMLFTIVDPESKYKAKNVIDTAVYRGGDMTSAWMITGLSQGLGYGFAGIAAVGAVAAALWSLVAVSLGRSYERRSSAHDEIAATQAKASEPA